MQKNRHSRSCACFRIAYSGVIIAAVGNLASAKAVDSLFQPLEKSVILKGKIK